MSRESWARRATTFGALGVALVFLSVCRGTTDSDSPFPRASNRLETSSNETTELRLATWNLEWLDDEPGHGTKPRNLADYARLAKYAARLDADVIALQEVDGAGAAARVFDPTRYDFHFASGNGPMRTGFAYKKSLRVNPHPDYKQLDVGGLRAGCDLSVFVGSTELRLLSVHLKSGCFARPLEHPSKACRKLHAQVPELEAWIDARATEGQRFAVLGDFNRRFFRQSGDALWLDLDDSAPPESDLDSPTRGVRSACWGGKYPDFIDHIVLGRSTVAAIVPGSFAQQLFDKTEKSHARVLSDHCPISVTLGF